MPDRSLKAVVEQLKAVAHPLRLRVLGLLAGGELCVCQVAEVLQVPVSSVSEALRELRRAGFVVERKDGRWVHVSLSPDRTPLVEALAQAAAELPEATEDRSRVGAVRGLGIPAVCQKQQKGGSDD